MLAFYFSGFFISLQFPFLGSLAHFHSSKCCKSFFFGVHSFCILLLLVWQCNKLVPKITTIDAYPPTISPNRCISNAYNRSNRTLHIKRNELNKCNPMNFQFDNLVDFGLLPFHKWISQQYFDLLHTIIPWFSPC